MINIFNVSGAFLSGQFSDLTDMFFVCNDHHILGHRLSTNQPGDSCHTETFRDWQRGLEEDVAIGEAATAVANGLTTGQLISVVRPHPTFCESFTEAVEAADGRAIHAAPPRR